MKQIVKKSSLLTFENIASMAIVVAVTMAPAIGFAADDYKCSRRSLQIC